MYLAYLDESDTRRKQERWRVMSAILIEDQSFKFTETGMRVAQDNLNLTPDQMEQFKEFHACELYGGHGAFQGIDQTLRFDTLKRLLSLPEMCGLSIVYGAVDVPRLSGEIYGSADPLDICFRICVQGIKDFMDERNKKQLWEKMGDSPEGWTTEKMVPLVIDGAVKDLTLLIVDECDKKNTKESLHKSFRALRPYREIGDNLFSPFHDDMYFGDSRYSLGIQLADACSYFIARHLHGDHETESFYDLIHPQIVRSSVYPETKGKSDSEAQLSLKGIQENDVKDEPTEQIRPGDENNSSC